MQYTKYVLWIALIPAIFWATQQHRHISQIKRDWIAQPPLDARYQNLSLRIDDLKGKINTAFNFIFKLYCTSSKSVLPSGGYCLNIKNIRDTWNPNWDGIMCASLEKIFNGMDILDMGAGRGHYGSCFLRRKKGFIESESARLVAEKKYLKEMSNAGLFGRPQVIKSWTGYDAALNIEEVTRGSIKYADLSQPLNLGRKYDWVLSLEVGEHIPKEYEQTYVENLVRHACKGIVISWAVPGQFGQNHINCQPMEYVHKMFISRGFTVDKEAQNYIRNNSQFKYYQHTFVFRVPKERAC